MESMEKERGGDEVTCLERPRETSGRTVATQPKCARPRKSARPPTLSSPAAARLCATAGSSRGSGAVFLRSVACFDQHASADQALDNPQAIDTLMLC